MESIREQIKMYLASCMYVNITTVGLKASIIDRGMHACIHTRMNIYVRTQMVGSSLLEVLQIRCHDPSYSCLPLRRCRLLYGRLRYLEPLHYFASILTPHRSSTILQTTCSCNIQLSIARNYRIHHPNTIDCVQLVILVLRRQEGLIS